MGLIMVIFDALPLPMWTPLYISTYAYKLNALVMHPINTNGDKYE